MLQKRRGQIAADAGGKIKGSVSWGGSHEVWLDAHNVVMKVLPPMKADVNYIH